MTAQPAEAVRFKIKEPKNLSPRIQWLRDYYFRGVDRAWDNAFTAWTTGTPWDVQWNEMTFYIVPENYLLLQTFVSSFRQAARPVALDPEFWTWSLPERRAWFVRETVVKYLPQEVLPGDLLAGARFNIQTSLCLTEREAAEHDRLVRGKRGARKTMTAFHEHGYGNAGATSGHLVPGHEKALKLGWKGNPRGDRTAVPDADRTRAERPRGRAAPGNDDLGDHAAGSRRALRRGLRDSRQRRAGQVAQGRAGRDGGDPAQGRLGAAGDVLGGGPGAVDQPHADYVRRELPGAGRLVRADRPVPAALLAAVDRRGDGPGVRQGDPQVLLVPRQHRLRRVDPRRPAGDHVGLRSAHHRLRDGRGRGRHDQRADLRDPGSDRRDVADPGTQTQRPVAPQVAGRPAGQGRGHGLVEPGRAVSAELRRALDGRDDARGQARGAGVADSPRQRARLRAGRVPGKHDGRQRPLGHRRLQPEPA